MPDGIVSPLKADDALSSIGQPVDDFSFAFVAPLSADDHYVLSHKTSFAAVPRSTFANKNSRCTSMTTGARLSNIMRLGAQTQRPSR
jgi:hypothetical protein